MGILFDTGVGILFDEPMGKVLDIYKSLNQAVKRNIGRFPDDFMFQLTPDELDIWRSQFVTSNPKRKMSLRRIPFVFDAEITTPYNCCCDSKLPFESR